MMAVSFNADEAFKMAIHIESNGAAFYRKAAELQSDASSREFLEGLASMEEDHKRTFMAMHKQLSRKRGLVYDSEGD